MKKLILTLALVLSVTPAHAADRQLNRDPELAYASQFSACEATVVSSHYDREGNLHEVVVLTDKQGNETVRQVMYKPLGFVPLGTGDEDYK